MYVIALISKFYCFFRGFLFHVILGNFSENFKETKTLKINYPVFQKKNSEQNEPRSKSYDNYYNVTYILKGVGGFKYICKSIFFFLSNQ